MLVSSKLVNVANCQFGSNTWINIGKQIYKLSNGDEKGYRVWRMYSQMDIHRFNEEFCRNVWNELLKEKSESNNGGPDDLPEWW